MGKSQVNLPKGMRDFGPEQMRKRLYIIDVIRKVFERYGYAPIETPVMENLTTLLGKGSAESDKLMFKVLNSGEYLKKVEEADLTERNHRAITSRISEKGLRYDLTVPLARFVVMHQNEITFPFKRYQIQPVWRADRPQKGRYREFWQCDADVLGSNSLVNEVELMQIFSEVYDSLGIDVKILINSRNLLAAIVEASGQKDKTIAFTIALDKLDKIGLEKVIEEMKSSGFDEKTFSIVQSIHDHKEDFLSSDIASELAESELGKKGIEEVQYIINNTDEKTSAKLVVDPTLARGLDYYTGPIFEIKTDDFPGSIGSGGRYDDLTGNFGLKDVSGVGISFGLDRIYDVMEDKGLFPNLGISATKILFVHFDESTLNKGLEYVNALRGGGISAEVYPDVSKLKKQMKYANSKSIAYVAVIGEEELKTEMITLKDMTTGDQESINLESLLIKLKE